MEKVVTPIQYKRLTKTTMSIAMIKEMIKKNVLNGYISEGGHYFIFYKGDEENV